MAVDENSFADTTQVLLEARQGGGAAADRLFPLIYDELRRLAGVYMRGERPDLTIGPTALVHEAYLRLIDQTRIQWQDRAHFLATAATAMRRVLVDHCRGRDAVKRGRGWNKVALDHELAPTPGLEVDVLAVDDAIEKLVALDHRLGQMVELRFFGGLTNKEVAAVQGVSVRTVEEDWRMAKAWLRRELSAQ